MAARRGNLHAVEPGEKPRTRRTPAKPKTVSEAAKGSTRELLVAMRDRIALAVENPNTPARDLAALTRRLLETAREIEAIDAREQEEAGGNADPGDQDFDPSTL